MYDIVCVYAVTRQECNYVFYTCTHQHHGHALAGRATPWQDKARVKLEAQRLTRMWEDATCKGGTEDDDDEDEEEEEEDDDDDDDDDDENDAERERAKTDKDERLC